LTVYGAPNITTKFDGDLKFGNNYNENDDENNDDYKPLDFGLNVLAGYQLTNGFNIGANYGLGLANLNPSGNSNNKESNNVISISVGFMF
ncbi:MAG: hypothetical protein WBP45_07360, partial [Daejeonella sp.]